MWLSQAPLQRLGSVHHTAARRVGDMRLRRNDVQVAVDAENLPTGALVLELVLCVTMLHPAYSWMLLKA